MLHTSCAAQIQQCIAKPGFRVANCNATPGILCPAAACPVLLRVTEAVWTIGDSSAPAYRR